MAWFYRAMLAGLLLATLNGCLPSGQSDFDEEKEPHFIAGRKCVNGMDYAGAVEEFEKAVEANPRNGKAHFQLGWLYEEKEPDPAAAIYHYQKFLKLRPNSENAEVVRQRINNCKQDLAKTVLPLPITPGMQRQIDEVMNENKRLKEENERWRTFVASRTQSATNLADASNSPARPQSVGSSVQSLNATSSNAGPVARSGAVLRTHSVQAGETPSSIARKYGVKLDALLAANPGLEPKHMRVGQSVNIP